MPRNVYRYIVGGCLEKRRYLCSEWPKRGKKGLPQCQNLYMMNFGT
jgi:hypothetical protein